MYVRKFKKKGNRNKNENQTKKTINVMWKRDDIIIIFVFHQQQRKSNSNNYSGPEGLPQSVSSAPSAQSRVPSQSCSKRMQVEPDMQSNSPNGHLSGLKVVSGLIRVSLPPAANRGSSSISSIKTSDSRSTDFNNEPQKIIKCSLFWNEYFFFKYEKTTHVQPLWHTGIHLIRPCNPRYHHTPYKRIIQLN